MPFAKLVCANSPAAGAKMNGARILEGVEVIGFEKKKTGRNQRITHIIHSEGFSDGEPANVTGRIEVEKVVLCGGIWARHLGLLAGVNIPVVNVQHQYMVSEPIPDLPTNLPTLRDPDALVYYKPEGEFARIFCLI